jgi:DNA-binding response OmpR family regulator
VPPNAVKLLYAEDEVLLRLMLADALHEAGFQVFEASDGEESISILKTMSVDVVVTDLRMATLTDGLELGRYVRAHCPGVSLVLASAQAPPIIDDVMFDAFFVKPFAPEDLVAWIKPATPAHPMLRIALCHERAARHGANVPRPANRVRSHCPWIGVRSNSLPRDEVLRPLR